MQQDIHPPYHPQAKITCACGQTATVGSTAPQIKVEICSNCHPFYTGKQKLVDTARRVEKFETKIAKQAAAAKTHIGKTAKRAALKEKRKTKIAIRKKPTVKKIGTLKTRKIKAKKTTKPQSQKQTKKEDQ